MARVDAGYTKGAKKQVQSIKNKSQKPRRLRTQRSDKRLTLRQKGIQKGSLKKQFAKIKLNNLKKPAPLVTLRSWNQIQGR